MVALRSRWLWRSDHRALANKRAQPVAIIDSRENLTRFHGLIVGDENLSNKAADLRRHHDLVGLQEGIVCRLLEAAVRPPMATKAASPAEREQERNDNKSPLAKGSRERRSSGVRER
jgi:hypothetical protein